MKPFDYVRPQTAKAALDAMGKTGDAMFIAGGTNLLDLMKQGVARPGKLIDINHLPLNYIEKMPEGAKLPGGTRGEMSGGLKIGALALNSEVADHPLVISGFPLLSQALHAGASPQLRNMATVGGNLLQRTRCPYFYNTDLPCNKREPGSGCGAMEGYNRMHAIFGASSTCVAVNPSDMSVALAALHATVLVAGPKGPRRIPIAEFHRLPGDHPERDTTLEKGELIEAVEIPGNPYNRNAHYLKVRDRASYAFALVSVAVGLDMDGSRIRSARLVMGGVAHKPWRLPESEQFLAGQQANEETFKKAADIALKGAKGLSQNEFKLTLAPNALVTALKTAAGLDV
jgi:xanthine dehydrogenase YagS FAD-binding subunit